MMDGSFMSSMKQVSDTIRQVVDAFEFSHNNGGYVLLQGRHDMQIDHFCLPANAFTIVLDQHIRLHGLGHIFIGLLVLTKEYFAIWKAVAIENGSVLFNVERVAVRA